MKPQGAPKYGRTRSAVVCPYCGLKYERFRSSSVPTFAEASEVMIAKAQRMVEEAGDYSKPARRSALLGFMHECKLRAWHDEHLEWCARAHASSGWAQAGDDEPPF